MKTIVDVQIGQVKTGSGKVILQSKAIGSCIAIVAYDPVRTVGALAHIMLPGSVPASQGSSEKTKYAVDAIDAILRELSQLGSKNEDLEVTLVGAGNVLKRADDTICKDNVESTLEHLQKRQLKVKAQALGGTKRRSVSLDVESGVISYSEGSGAEKPL